MYLNSVTIVGNLTRDPEIKQLPSGNMVCNFGMATNRYYKDSDGNRQDQVEYHNLVAFGKQGELIGQYLRKGSQALVQGRLQTRSWETDGQKNYRTEIIVETVQFGSRRDDNKDTVPESKDSSSEPVEDVDPADIPF